jgi:hypothetical protein
MFSTVLLKLLLPLAVTAILLAHRVSRGATRLYFKAQLLNTLVGLAIYYLLGPHNRWYLAATIILTAPILEMCVIMLRESRIERQQVNKAFFFAVALSMTGIYGFVYHSSAEFFDVLLASAMALVGMAMLLAMDSQPVTFRALGTLYIGLSVFYFGYVRHWPEWDRTASWLPTLMGIAAFGWIALKGGDRVQSETDAVSPFPAH